MNFRNPLAVTPNKRAKSKQTVRSKSRKTPNRRGGLEGTMKYPFQGDKLYEQLIMMGA
jgi:hypothetical protein